MAKPCPKCKRPNNDRATMCIYCGTSFPVTPPPEKKAPQASGDKAAAPMTQEARPESYLVVVSPCPSIGEAEATKFKNLLNVDAYTAGLKLKQPAPWVARTYSEMKSAQDLSNQLIELGIESYVIKQSGLDKISQRFQAARIKELGEDKAVFIAEDRKEMEVYYSDVFLIVQGKIKEKPELSEEQQEYSPDSFNKSPAASAPEQSQGGRFQKAIQQMSLKPENIRQGKMTASGRQIQLMDIYRKSSPYPVRIVESEFDYSGLGENKTSSGLLNYYYIYNKLKESAPQAAVDENFNLTSYTLPENPKEDKVRNDLMTELGDSPKSRRLYDNRACFDDYSARIYLHQLHQNRKKKPSKAGNTPS